MYCSDIYFETSSVCVHPFIRETQFHPHKASGKIMVLFILIFMFLVSRWALVNMANEPPDFVDGREFLSSWAAVGFLTRSLPSGLSL